ncbi:MAG TPA: CDGSH iron-sulfur domain-containing protein [Burkholderiaceae bacterium]
MAGETKVEFVAGAEIELAFDPTLCIHSRFCVLQAPAVFQANTPGAWIRPDEMSAPALAAVARNCPSGAIAYRATVAVLDEAAPPVNTIRLRQDGPYAVNAAIRIVGHERAQPVHRRTLCRCGASRNKPFCDGSHAAIGFEATGEPPTDPAIRALDPRDGPLVVTPMPDGPLEIAGPAELVSGTGRTIAKTAHALLCRCGGSRAKPFCDGTHSLNGFTDRADGPHAPAPAADGGAQVPTLAEWAGGPEAFQALAAAFYAKVPADPVLAHVFADMDRRHVERVGDFLAEVLGGPPAYSRQGGSHVGMIARHLGRHITEAQRARWVELLVETAAEIGLPADAAFRAAFASYLEWGSKLAVINSAPGLAKPEGDWPMPAWGWGPAGGPALADPPPEP